MNDSVKLWLDRAESSYKLGVVEKEDGIFYEDLCFQLQQACEKALKAVLIHFDIEPPKTHSFGILLQKIESKIEVPLNVKDVITLNSYAVQTRYPGDYVPVDEVEYLEIKEITEMVLDWVNVTITDRL
ncbi:MAG: HEPN domain-containing protein [Spirochaetales bacterium]|nr:HEPN domain-containing protein [Spirochaetales bacterium]